MHPLNFSNDKVKTHLSVHSSVALHLGYTCLLCEGRKTLLTKRKLHDLLLFPSVFRQRHFTLLPAKQITKIEETQESVVIDPRGCAWDC